MISTSKTYVPDAASRIAGMRVKIRIEDLTARANAEMSVTESHAFASRSLQVLSDKSGMSAKYGTCEKDQFVLDGSCTLFPDNPDTEQVGWWSASQTGENCAFAQPITITFDFSQPHSSAGFTIVFDDKADEYCTDFSLITYDAEGAELSRADLSDNREALCILNLPTDDYYRVVLILRKTNNPYRFARISQMVFGFLHIHVKGKSASLNLLYEISPTMESAPANEMQLTIDNADGGYNIINPDGFYRYLHQGQIIDTELAVGVSRNDLSNHEKAGVLEYVDTGRFYFTSARSSDDSLTAQITAHSPFYVMDKIKHVPQDGTSTVKDFIQKLFDDCGIEITVVAADDVGNRSIKTNTGEVSYRESVRLAAQAARCVCMIDRNKQAVLFDPIVSMTATDRITLDEQYNMPTVETSERINTVVLTVGMNEKYTAQQLDRDELPQQLDISNPLVTEGQAVAEWLLTLRRNTYKYAVQDRGNPARETGDTVQIYDAYGEQRNALVTKLQLFFDGGLVGEMAAIGGRE